MSNSGKIKKSRQTERFTTIPNSILEDRRLSLKAIGLLCYILRLPSDWIIHKTKLHINLRDGRDAVLAAFKELQQTGYIVAEEVRESGKFSGFNYTVYDKPLSNQDFISLPETENPETVKPITEKAESALPITEKPESEKPNSENPELLNTNNTKDLFNQNPSSKEEGLPGSEKATKPKKKEAPPVAALPPQEKTLYQRFVDIYFDWHKTREGIPPKIDGAQGNAAKAIIGHLKVIVRDKAKSNLQELTDIELDNQILISWNYILSGWDYVEAFYQGRTRLVDINSNIQILIKQIKDGFGKQGTGNNKAQQQAERALQILHDRKNAGDGAPNSNGTN